MPALPAPFSISAPTLPDRANEGSRRVSVWASRAVSAATTAFRRLHVGPLPQRLGGNAERQALGHRRQRDDGGEFRDEGAGLGTGQRGQPIHRLARARLERRDGGARLLEVGACLFDVELGDESGLRPEAGQLERLGLAGDVALGHIEARLQRAQFEIGGRDIGGERHVRAGQVGGHGLQVGGGGVAALADAADDVRLPAGVQTAAVGAGVDVDDAGLAVESEGALTTPPRRRRARRRHGRPQRRRGLRLQRPGLLQARLRDPHVRAAVDGTGDEGRQRRVGELFPPAREIGAGGGVGGGGRLPVDGRDRPRRRAGGAGRGATGEGRGECEQSAEGVDSSHCHVLIHWTLARARCPSGVVGFA